MSLLKFDGINLTEHVMIRRNMRGNLDDKYINVRGQGIHRRAYTNQNPWRTEDRKCQSELKEEISLLLQLLS